MSLQSMLKASLAQLEQEKTGSTYVVVHGEVFMIGASGPIRLSEQSREDLLNIYLREGAAREFNALHQAHTQAGGIAFQ